MKSKDFVLTVIVSVAITLAMTEMTARPEADKKEIDDPFDDRSHARQQ